MTEYILITLGLISLFLICFFLTDVIWPSHKWRKPKEGQNKKDGRLLKYQFHKESGDTRKHLIDYTLEEFMELKVAVQDRLIDEASSEECDEWIGNDVIDFKEDWQTARKKIKKGIKRNRLVSSMTEWILYILLLLALAFLTDYFFNT